MPATTAQVVLTAFVVPNARCVWNVHLVMNATLVAIARAAEPVLIVPKNGTKMGLLIRLLCQLSLIFIKRCVRLVRQIA